MHDAGEKIYTYRITQKVRTGGSSFFAVLLFLGGLVCCLTVIGWPLGLILFALAVMIDAKTATVSHCDYCGNQVSNTCVLCPVCRADLAPQPFSWRNTFTKPKVVFVVVFLLVVFIGVVVTRMSPDIEQTRVLPSLKTQE